MEESTDRSVNKEEIEDESVITLDEFIEEETRLETDASALLGPSDDKNCTYNQGYMGRQALYACKTCSSEEGAKVAGVCLACTYHCHEGHDLVELYTKRAFRCDCGNTRFKNKKCNLVPEKEPENLKNSYNHNFEGSYCTCKRPYPDPEDSVADEMIQCIICEDWYHTRHLLAEMPSEENYAEMICSGCTEKLPFLNKYLGYSVMKLSKEEIGAVDVIKNGDSSGPTAGDATTDGGSTSCDNATVQEPLVNGESSHPQVINKADNVASSTNGDIDKVPINEKTVDTNISGAKADSTQMNQNGLNTEIEATPSSSSDKKTSSSGSSQGCLLERLKDVKREKCGASFWTHNFRTLLCSCDSCKEMYGKLGVSYLLDLNDTVQAYEEKGRTVTNSDSSKHSVDRVLGMLSNIGMDRFSQAEAILNYNELKSNLSEYLSKFVENKKVVREEDIREFFTQLNARKRQKLDVPFSCR